MMIVGAMAPTIWNQFEMFHLVERINKIIRIENEIYSMEMDISILIYSTVLKWNVEETVK